MPYTGPKASKFIAPGGGSTGNSASSWQSQVSIPPTPDKPPGKPPGRTDGRTWRADAGAWMTDGEYAEWLNREPEGDRGFTYTPSAWTPPAINLPIPDYAWNPTVAQKEGWNTTANARMALKYDPVRADIIAGLARYKSDVDLAKRAAYDTNVAQNLGLANVIKNTVKQGIIDNAIARGATTGGWLQDALEGAGRYETSERQAMNKTYNTTIDDLVNAVLQREEESNTQLTDLSGLQGQDLLVALDELENRDRTRRMEELTNTFNSRYQKESLINQVAAQMKAAEQQDALIQAQLAQSAFENKMAEKNYALNALQTKYNTSYGGSGSANANANKIPVNVNGTTVYMSPNEYVNYKSYTNPYVANSPLDQLIEAILSGDLTAKK